MLLKDNLDISERRSVYTFYRVFYLQFENKIIFLNYKKLVRLVIKRFTGVRKMTQ